MAPSTPSTASTMKPRMVVVYGSQTGTCRMLANKTSESWKQRGLVESVAVFDGNTLAHETEDLASLKEDYDLLVVITSSYGDGDPPENYNEFIAKLLASGSGPEELQPLANCGRDVFVFHNEWRVVRCQ